MYHGIVHWHFYVIWEVYDVRVMSTQFYDIIMLFGGPVCWVFLPWWVMWTSHFVTQQTTDIMNVMYDSVTNDIFDRVSDDIDRVSGVVDNNSDMTDTDNVQMTLTMTMIMTLPQVK